MTEQQSLIKMDGIKKATSVKGTRDGEKFSELQISEFKILDKVDPKTFIPNEEALQEIKDDGPYAKIYEEWIGQKPEEIP